MKKVIKLEAWKDHYQITGINTELFKALVKAAGLEE